MIVTPSSLAPGAPGFGFTAEAVRIVERVEAEVIEGERAFGRPALLHAVASIGLKCCQEHTQDYQQVIRKSEWPNGTWVGVGHQDFLRGYERSARAYVRAGFDALRFLTGRTKLTLDEMYPQVLAAEALRGQFGKSSPDGLDKRRDALADHFPKNGYGSEDELMLLCTPAAPIRTAEMALLGDFSEFKRVFPTPPNIDDVLATPEPQEKVVWGFLRRWVRWNVEALALLYRGSLHAVIDGSGGQGKEQHRSQLLEKLPPAGVTLVDSISSLMVLDLVLEPQFSFKGCVGLPLGEIFRLAKQAGRSGSVNQVQLLLDRSKLFNNAG